jgi:hypothetical protein
VYRLVLPVRKDGNMYAGPPGRNWAIWCGKVGGEVTLASEAGVPKLERGIATADCVVRDQVVVVRVTSLS